RTVSWPAGIDASRTSAGSGVDGTNSMPSAQAGGGAAMLARTGGGSLVTSVNGAGVEPWIAARSALANPSTLGYRSAESLASPRMITASISAPSAGTSSDGNGGSVWTTSYSTAIGFSPRNGS